VRKRYLFSFAGMPIAAFFGISNLAIVAIRGTREVVIRLIWIATRTGRAVIVTLRCSGHCLLRLVATDYYSSRSAIRVMNRQYRCRS
jgi:hypothetical protein